MGFDFVAITGPSLASFFSPLISALVSALVLVVGLAVGRSPISSPLTDLEFQRQMTAGSDALLERMVIPPHRPDWLLSDCGQITKRGSLETSATFYDRKRQAICEAARKQTR